MREREAVFVSIIEVFHVIEDGTLPAKATEGESLSPFDATVFREGHDAFAARPSCCARTG